MKSRKQVRFVALLVIFTVLGFIQCKKLIVNSQWANEPIKIDGQTTEWESVLSYDEDLDVSYGIQNDDHSLYMAFVTTDQELQRQMMMRGLVLWVDADGGKEKDFGIKFPRGLMERGMPAPRVMAAMRNARDGGNEAEFDNFVQQNFRDLQVVDAKGQNLGIYTQHEAKEYNIQFALKCSPHRMIYELCLPLECTGRHPWSIVAPNVGICFETPEIGSSMGGMRPGPSMTDASGGGGMRGGGGRGGRGGPGGGMGDEEMVGGTPGGMGPQGGGKTKNLKVWLTATLATK
jgi:hypothetical protein